MARTRDYELVIVLSPQVDNQQAKGTVERVHRFIEERGGTILRHEPWGMRRLAYPIRHFKEGNYFLTQFRLDAEKAREVEQALRVTEEVIRQLLVRVEE